MGLDISLRFGAEDKGLTIKIIQSLEQERGFQTLKTSWLTNAEKQQVFAAVIITEVGWKTTHMLAVDGIKITAGDVRITPPPLEN